MIGFFAGHPTAANLLMLAFLMVGFAFAGTVKRETFPDIPADSVEVRVPFRGAAALDVEEAVCLRIEDVADAVDGREETRCEAREGLAVATLVMREGGDIERFLNDVKTEVEGIQDFPEAAEAPVVRQLGRRDFVASIAVAGPLRPEGLKAYAERNERRSAGDTRSRPGPCPGFFPTPDPYRGCRAYHAPVRSQRRRPGRCGGGPERGAAGWRGGDP